MKLYTSKYLQAINAGTKVLVYNSLTGKSLVANKQTARFINLFKGGFEADMFAGDTNMEIHEMIVRLYRSGLLAKARDGEREKLNDLKTHYISSLQADSQIEALTLIVSEKCNFSCEYCYQKVAEFGEHSLSSAPIKRMNSRTAFRAMDLLLSSAQKKHLQKVRVGFNGGEALLNWALIEDIIKKYHDNCANIEIDWGLNTNASLITQNIAKTLKQYSVSVSTSLDGTKAIHNSTRKFHNGKGTYDKVLQGIQFLQNEGVPFNGVYCVLNKNNYRDVSEKFIINLKRNGIKAVTIEPEFTSLYPRDAKQIAKKLLGLVILGHAHGVRVEGTWKRPFNLLVSGEKSQSNFFCLGVSGKGVAIDPRGNLIICGGAGNKTFGNIWDSDLELSFTNEWYDFIGCRFVGSISMCKDCPIEGLCKGECSLIDSIAEIEEMPQLKLQRCDLVKNITKRLVKHALL